MFDARYVGWFIHGTLLMVGSMLVVGRPRRLFGAPDRRARGWCWFAAVLSCVGAPMLMWRGRPGVAGACLVIAGLELWAARVLWARRPVGALPVQIGEAVEAHPDGFVGRVVECGPWDFAVTVEDVMGQRRVYATDQVSKIESPDARRARELSAARWRNRWSVLRTVVYDWAFFAAAVAAAVVAATWFVGMVT